MDPIGCRSVRGVDVGDVPDFGHRHGDSACAAASRNKQRSHTNSSLPVMPDACPYRPAATAILGQTQPFHGLAWLSISRDMYRQQPRHQVTRLRSWSHYYCHLLLLCMIVTDNSTGTVTATDWGFPKISVHSFLLFSVQNLIPKYRIPKPGRGPALQLPLSFPPPRLPLMVYTSLQLKPLRPWVTARRIPS